jgi:hypothetical protein
MAVVIDELQIDVRSGSSAGPAQPPADTSPKKPVDLRKQITLLAERRARLTTE